MNGISQPGRTIYAERRGRLAFLALIGLLFVAGGIAIMRNGDPAMIAVGLSAIVFFGFTSVVLFLRLFAKHSGVILSADGIQYPQAFTDTVPWEKVSGLAQRRVNTSRFLKVTMDPAFAASLKWRGLVKLLGRHPNTFTIPLSQLDAPGDEIIRMVQALWSESREKAHAQGLPVSEAPQKPYAAIVAPARPAATYGLIALFAAVYVCELVFSVDHKGGLEPSTLTLAYLGGDMGIRVKGAGEVWRMFTAPLMHAGLLHIGFNSLALWWAGSALERMTGWKWLLGVFALTALAGEAASVMFLNPHTVGVGASGGIMGVIAALLVAAGRLPNELSSRFRSGALQYLIPALLPAFTGGTNINVFAHAGGAVAGAVLGFVLLKFWPPENAKPPLSNAMLAAALVFFAVAAYAVYPISRLLAAG